MPAPAAIALGGATALASATQGVTGAFAELAGTIKPFIEALNPGAVQVFSLAMRDLSAVIGQALMPIFAEMTRVVREVASALLPVTRDLAPAFARIAQAVGSLAVPVIQLFASVLQTMLPWWEGLARSLVVVTRAAVALGAGLGALLEGFGFGGAMESAGEMIVKATQQLAKTVIIGAASLAAAFARTSVITAMIRSLTPPPRGPSAEGFAAPLNPAFTSFADYGRQLALRSSIAGAGETGPRSSEDWLKEVVEKLKEIETESKRLEDKVKKAVDEGIRGAWEGFIMGFLTGGRMIVRPF